MWKSSCRRVGTAALVAALVAASTCASAWGATDDGGQPAVWTPKELQFTYSGFTTRYTCDGLRDRIRTILLTLGARKSDLKVVETPCSGNPDRPNPFPGVKIKMSVLQPTDQKPTPDGQIVTAHWQPVDLLKGEYGIDAAGECELLEQVNQKIVPLFPVRNVDIQTSCTPHQLSPTGTRLKAEALIADPMKPADKRAAAN
jgi:hypothetical protein